jgi:LysM repeat protein
MSAVSISGYTLKWYDNADDLLATGSTGPVPSTVASGSTTYKVTQTNGTTLCESSALLVTVTVNALPSISVVGGASQTVCDGSSITLNGDGGVSYSWSGVDASGISNGVSFTPSSSSSYTVTGTDGNGCSSTATASVTVNTPPTINAGSDVEICAGETVTLSGSGAGTGGSYSWSGRH